MSVFGEFRVPAESFALHRTFQTIPDGVIEIDRVVATPEVLTPYFWVSETSFESFERATQDDPSIQNLRQLDVFEDSDTALYRGDWTERIEALVYAYTQTGAIILEALGTNEGWELRMRFDDRDRLKRFQRYCREHDVDFDLNRLYELTQPRTGGQFGLTKKQQEALVKAYHLDYFDTSRETTLADVAEEIDITQQSLSDRLRRGFDALIANTLVVTSDGEVGRENKSS